jgi:hypothetical protein
MGLVAAATARACFVGVPWELFQARHSTLTATPVNSFTWEASHLVTNSPAPARQPSDDPDTRRAAAEAEGLSPTQQTALLAMRAAPDVAAALVAGHDLPPAIRLYTAGAVAFAKADVPSAKADFDAVLALPPNDAAPRAVWAAYMLGRLADQQADRAAAAAAYRQARSLVRDGRPDPLDLATASLGDEAKPLFEAGVIPAAVALYAQQAAAGSPEAVQSLRMVAESIMADPARLDPAVRDPLTARLLVVHALALTGDYLHQLHTGGTVYEIPYDGFFDPEDLDTKPVAALFEAIQRLNPHVPGSDRLAALAYQLGDYGAAKDLATASGTPLALWIQAKVALQQGQDARSAALLAQALHASAEPAAAASLEPSSIGLLHGEAAISALGHSDFVMAMTVLWPFAKTYWGDAAYLAERLLSTNELKAFVDANAPKATATDQDGPVVVNSLRGLLARRLMRDGRLDEALPYFAGLDTADSHPGADAAAYAEAFRRRRSAFWSTDRAQAAWDAAVLLRQSGLEMMGTETYPDNAPFGGDFAIGYGAGPGGPSTQQDAPFTTDELVRLDASHAQPNLRFHYRYLAVDQAQRAVDDLPPRSQAAAAILCQAAHWMLSSGADERARAIYRRYVTTGAVVPFATHFGHDCPDPDFSAVQATRRTLAVAEARDVVHRHKPAILVGGSVAALLAAAIIWRRRRRA